MMKTILSPVQGASDCEVKIIQYLRGNRSDLMIPNKQAEGDSGKKFLIEEKDKWVKKKKSIVSQLPANDMW